MSHGGEILYVVAKEGNPLATLTESSMAECCGWQVHEKRGLQLIVLIPAKNAIAEPDSARMHIKAAEHPRELVR